jgi:hypothetical protein
MRELTADQSPKSFLIQHKKTSLDEKPLLCGYNYHDCHVLLPMFLPIAIRVIKPIYVKMLITRLCYFFNKISKKVIDEDELQDLQEFIGETMA